MSCTIGAWLCDNIEVWKLLASTATPVIAATVAIYVARSGILTDRTKTINQKLIKQRLSIYRDVASKINEMYCYMIFVGRWKSFSPHQILENKRFCNSQMHVYRALFSSAMFDSYSDFIECCFDEFQGLGKPAKIRLNVRRARENWREEWCESWIDSFSDGAVPAKALKSAYERFMRLFARELGAEGAEWHE